MIILLLTTSLAFASSNWSEIEKDILKNLPKLISSQRKIVAQEGKINSQEGEFDNKIKAKTLNQFENVYDNQFHQVELSKQNRLLGSRLFLGHRQGTGFFPVYDQKYATSSVGEIYAGFDLPLLRNLLTDNQRTNLEIERIELQIRKEQWRQDAIEVLVKSYDLYLKWIVASEKLRVYKRLLNHAESRQEFFEKKTKAGDIERIKLTDNLRTLSKRKAEYIKAELEWENVKIDFSSYYPKINTTALADVPAISHLNFKADKSFQKDNLPQFRIINFEIQQSMQKISYYHSQSLPELNLMVQGSRDLGTSSFIKDPDQLRFGVQIEIPIENNKAKGSLSEQRSKQKAIEAQLQWLERLWDNKLKQLDNSISRYIETKAQIEREVESSILMSSAERQRLSQGDGDLFIINIREQDEAEAEVKKLNITKDINYLHFLKASLSGEIAAKIDSPKT